MELASDLLNPEDPEDQPSYEIVYPDGEEANVRVEPHLYPESFTWPAGSPWCSATMISDRVAITSAHCVLYPSMDGENPTYNNEPMSVSLTNSI